MLRFSSLVLSDNVLQCHRLKMKKRKKKKKGKHSQMCKFFPNVRYTKKKAFKMYLTESEYVSDVLSVAWGAPPLTRLEQQQLRVYPPHCPWLPWKQKCLGPDDKKKLQKIKTRSCIIFLFFFLFFLFSQPLLFVLESLHKEQ